MFRKACDGRNNQCLTNGEKQTEVFANRAKRTLEDEVKDMRKMDLKWVVRIEQVAEDEAAVAAVVAVVEADGEYYEDRGSGCCWTVVKMKDCSGYFGLVLNERGCVDDSDADFPNDQGLRYSPPPYTLVLDAPSVSL